MTMSAPRGNSRRPGGDSNPPRDLFGPARNPEEEINFEDDASRADSRPSDSDPDDSAADDSSRASNDGSTTSRVSSVYSAGDEEVNFASLLDLTGPDWCMVRMTRRINGRQVPCVCVDDAPRNAIDAPTPKSDPLAPPGPWRPLDSTSD